MITNERIDARLGQREEHRTPSRASRWAKVVFPLPIEPWMR